MEELTFNESKIRTLLKRYGVNDQELENFMEDLKNFVEDKIEEKTGQQVEFDSDNDFENWDK